MEDKKRKLFSDDDFDKSLIIGDELVFDKPELTKIRLDLTWKGTDLDICAFLLGKDGLIHSKEDLVYFNSQRRWKTNGPLVDGVNVLDGKVYLWEDACKEFKNKNKWMAATLPISSDDSVIGSWDDMDDSGDSAECGETMHVLLDEVDTRKYRSIVFAAVVAKDRIVAGETFADAHEPVVTIYNAEDESVIAEYKLASSFPGKDAVCVARLDYDTKSMLWNFVPMSEGYNGGMQFLATEVFN
jgi:stress response protein SCP2